MRRNEATRWRLQCRSIGDRALKGGCWWWILGLPCTCLRRNTIECQKFAGFGEVDQGAEIRLKLGNFWMSLAMFWRHSFRIPKLLPTTSGFPNCDMKILHFAKGVLSLRYTQSLKDGSESCGKSSPQLAPQHFVWKTFHVEFFIDSIDSVLFFISIVHSSLHHSCLDLHFISFERHWFWNFKVEQSAQWQNFFNFQGFWILCELDGAELNSMGAWNVQLPMPRLVLSAGCLGIVHNKSAAFWICFFVFMWQKHTYVVLWSYAVMWNDSLFTLAVTQWSVFCLIHLRFQPLTGSAQRRKAPICLKEWSVSVAHVRSSSYHLHIFIIFILFINHFTHFNHFPSHLCVKDNQGRNPSRKWRSKAPEPKLLVDSGLHFVDSDFTCFTFGEVLIT